MCAVIKNGKLHTINIYIRKILILIIASLPVTCAYSGIEPGKKWVIVIDAGHGGKDPGAIGSFSREKNINLAIALKTGEYIEKNIKNVKVVYTRKGDYTVDLYERPKIANENNADLFISIHTNKTSSRSVMGAETYIMGLTKDQQNLEVAMKENEVILLEDDYSTKYQGFDPKSPESYIMFTLMQNVFQKQSTDLAARIQTQFTEKLERKDRGVKQAGFWVLFNTTMPSVLIETGFISNPVEEKFLNSEKGQDYIASAIYKACREYIDEINSRSVPFTAATKDTVQAAIDTVALADASVSEIAFMVQVSASMVKTEISPANFKGLKEIYELNTDGRYKYVSGKFSEYTEALKYRKELKKIYPDAFVIAVRNNRILPLQEALNQTKKK
jgi:N-acetylmuramoyl-L-alanine amidase